MEPEERRKVSLMQALSTIRNEKVAIRKDAAQRRKQVNNTQLQNLAAAPLQSVFVFCARRMRGLARVFVFRALCLSVHVDPSSHVTWSCALDLIGLTSHPGSR